MRKVNKPWVTDFSSIERYWVMARAFGQNGHARDAAIGEIYGVRGEIRENCATLARYSAKEDNGFANQTTRKLPSRSVSGK